jgi:hypothetical protein
MPMENRDKVLLLGSVGLSHVERVMATAGELLGPYLRRLPDGEISIEPGAPRRGFVTQLRPIASESRFLEPDPEEVRLGRRRTLDAESHRNTRPPRFRVRSGVDAATIRFETTGLAKTAIDSYAIFTRLKEAGAIPQDVRFQVCLPTVAAFLNTHIVFEAHRIVEAPYRAALFADVDRIAATVPAPELTIQWDVSTEMAQWEGVREAWFPDVRPGVIERLAHHCDRVPDGVELGVHLCYGNFGLRHWREPESLENTVAVYNGLAAKASRAIDYVHMPVPIDRSDDAYFAPLDGLRLRPETTLYLGLIHEQDGVDGARRRIAAAHRHVAAFGIATECGFGERPADIVPGLMRLHVEVAKTLVP